jgi:hypothetical protein
MSAAKYDFAIEQGTSFRVAFVYKDSDGNVIDLTGWCARLIWKTNVNDIHTFSTTNIDYSQYKFTIDEPNGKLTLLFPSLVTNGFTFSDAKYDLELQSPDDHYPSGGKFTIRILYGTIKITKRNSLSTTQLDCQNE